MKILFDHCVPRRLRADFPAHEIRTAREMGWDRLRNGDLLKAAAEGKFDAMLTVDRNIRYQQNVSLPLALIVVVAISNRLADIRTLVPLIENALKRMVPRTYQEIGSQEE